MCFRTGLRRAARFRTAGLLINMLSYRLASWKQVFVQMASWLILFRIDFKIFVRFHTEGIVIIHFRIEYLCIRTGVWRVAFFRTAGIFTYTPSNRFASSNDVFAQMASWHKLFRKDLSIFLRFHTEDIVTVRFNLYYLCFRVSPWRVACFRTAGLLTSMLSNRFSSWNFVFVHTASSLVPFRIDLEMFGCFRIPW